MQIRQLDAPVVEIPWTLDETAPANPNYTGGGGSPKTTTMLPMAALSDVSNLQLELVPGMAVPPRMPRMPEPTRIVSITHSSVLLARLVYLHFGLEYTLSLRVPSHIYNQGDCLTFDFAKAQLSITIRDWQK